MSAILKPVLYGDAVRWGLLHAEALLMLAQLPDNCAHAVVTDPPYALALAGEAWDSFGGDGTPPSEAFERWTALWAAQCLRVLRPGGHLLAFGAPRTCHRLASGIEDAGFEIRDQLLWVYGTGVPKSPRLPDDLATTLKPAYEPVVLARTPLEGTTKTNLEIWGTGALNIGQTRVGQAGYWPANLTLSHAPDCPAGLIDAPVAGPSRLFYCAKTSKQERETGCEPLPGRQLQIYNGSHHKPRFAKNTHPTVKPVALMRWLVKLVTPRGGVVLDPFTGSGSTGIAALLEGRQFIGIERETEYVQIARARLEHWARAASKERL